MNKSSPLESEISVEAQSSKPNAFIYTVCVCVCVYSIPLWHHSGYGITLDLVNLEV